MDVIKVLITGGGAPGIRGTLYSLKHNWDKRNVITVCVDMRTNAVGKYLCDRFYQVPPGTNRNFVSCLLDICEKEHVDVVLPQVTLELLPLSIHLRKFKDIGTSIAISKTKAIEIANNKYKLLKIAKTVGIPAPKFVLVKKWDELLKAAEKLGFPFVIKPPVGSGMRGFRVIYKEIDRKRAFFEEKPDSTKTTLQDLYSILGEKFPKLLATEYLPGMEYSVDILSDESQVYTVIPRRRDHIRLGITFEGTVEKREDIINASIKLSNKIGLEYAYGFQFKEDINGIPKILESNPRIQGTMVLSSVAGANVIYGAVKLALGEDIPLFNVRWGTKLLRYWGGIGIAEKVIEI